MKKVLFMAVVGLVVSLSLVGCAPKKVESPPASVVSPVAEGKELYSANCAVCHGPNAEGTAAGPAIAGHSLSAIKMQVRNPMGTMPAFPPAQLSDRELDEIAEFIAGMSMAKSPMMEWEKAATETMHHWMALLAIKGGDAEDAKHHLRDVLTFVKEPAHKAEIEKVLNMIAQGNMHDAEHEIEEMAGAESPSGITMKRFHLMLAQRGVEAEDVTEIKHHLIEHFLTLATEPEKELAREAVELAHKGDFHEAEHEIEELLKF